MWRASPIPEQRVAALEPVSRGVSILIGAHFVKRDISGFGRTFDFLRLTFVKLFFGRAQLSDNNSIVNLNGRLFAVSAVHNALLICGLTCGLVLSAVWTGFLGYEFFRFVKFVF